MAEPEVTSANGQDPVPGSPAVPDAPTKDDGSPSPGDYLSKVRGDPEFAEKEIRKHQRKVSELSAAQKRLGRLQSAIDQLGSGEVVYQQLERFNNLLGNQAMSRLIQRYESTGTLPTGGEDPYGSSVEDEDPQSRAMNELRAEVRQLRAEIDTTRGAVGKTRISQDLDKLRTRYPNHFDDFIKPYLDEKFGEWEQTPAGRRVLAELDYDGLRTLAARALDDRLEEVGELAHLRKQENLKKSATPAPSGTATTGRERAPSAGFKHVREALAAMDAEEAAGARRSR